MHSLTYRLFLSAVVAVLATPGMAHASEIVPLYSFNQSPVIGIFGLPAIGSARVLKKEETVLAFRTQISNNYTGADNGREQLSLDGESYRNSFMMNRGLGAGREWGVELSYLMIDGGFLDGPIEGFHDLFGFKQGGRDTVPRKRVNYRFTRQGQDLFRVDEPVSGPGDFRFTAATQLQKKSAENGYDVALRGSLKLPTGNSTDLLGSGSTDLAVWLSAARAMRPNAWNGYGGIGLMLMTTGDVLPAQQQRQILFGALGFARKISAQLSFNVQLDGHSPFYSDTGFRQFNAYALQGLIGIVWEFLPKTYLEFSGTEDVIVNTSPDAVFLLSLTLPFRTR